MFIPLLFQDALEESVLKFVSVSDSALIGSFLCSFIPSRSTSLPQLLRLLQRPLPNSAAREAEGAVQHLPTSDAHLGPGKVSRGQGRPSQMLVRLQSGP